MKEPAAAERLEQTQETVTEKPKVDYHKKPVYDLIKRIFDVVCSLLALIILSPVFLIVMAAIMIDDFGNPFYVQDRAGYRGKVFKMIKFRSMYKDADKQLTGLLEKNEYSYIHFKMGNDPRVTSVGKFIRRTSIDELPQLFNVIKGDMSLIGPRPFICSEQEQLPADRLLVKPGLSCYWQISNTTKMSSEEQLELDYRYIRERSVLTDIKLMLKTASIVLFRKNI